MNAHIPHTEQKWLKHETPTKTLLLTLLLCILCVLFLVGCNHPPLQIGSKPQPMEITDRYGKKMAFPEDLKGKVAMVRFWTVSCPYCNKEIFKAMERLYVKYKDQGFVMVSVNVNQPPEGDEGLSKIDKLITYPVLLDPNAAMAEFYGVKTFPTTFILTRDGVVKEKVIGDSYIDTFESLFTPLLK